MKYFLSLFAALVLSINSFGQLTLADSNHCTYIELYANLYSAVPRDIGLYSDDLYSGILPIGFTFNFYGTPYTNMIVGENGTVCFNTALASGGIGWSITSPLLGNPTVYNSICGPWCDILGTVGMRPIYYTIQGLAPNRTAAITWCSVAMFSCTTQWITTQILMYETSNVAEVHIAHKTICAAWNGGNAIVGVQNSTGTAATAAPGRDFPSSWAATNEAWRFTPVGAGTSYTCSSIPFSPIPYGVPVVYWYDSTTGAYLGTGDSIRVTPTVPTTYKAGALTCNDTIFAYIHVNPIGTGIAPHITPVKFNPSECGACDGKIVLHGLNPTYLDTVFYAFNGIPQPTFFTNPLADSTITISGLCAGIVNYAYIKHLNCPSNQITDTMVTPILRITSTTKTNPTVCGKCDGSITLHGLFPNKPITVTYTRNGVAQPPVSGTTMPDSTFTLTNLCDGTYSPISARIRLCTAAGTLTVISNPAPIVPTFTDSVILGCKGEVVRFTNTTNPQGYNSYWSFGDGTGIGLDSSTNPVHTFYDTPSYVGSYNVTLVYESYHNPACKDSVTHTISFNHPISVGFTSNVDTLCLGTPFLFTNTSTTTFPATYYWDFGDVQHDTATNPSHTYAIGGIYHTNMRITDQLGCTLKTADHELYVVSLDINTRIQDTSVCIKDSMTLWMIAPKYTPDWTTITYQWSAVNGTDNLGDHTLENAQFMGYGQYKYMVIGTTSPYACYDTAYETIHSYPPVTLTNLTTSGTIVFGSTIHLNADGATYYVWAPNDGTLDNPNINNPWATPVNAVTTYTVTGMNQFGCASSAEIVINLDFTSEDQTPTAFTPNGDGLNDVFKLTNLKFQKIVEFCVYNRWGIKVFSTNEADKGWDGYYNGVAQDIGVYHYQVIVSHPDGQDKVYKGDVTLIR